MKKLKRIIPFILACILSIAVPLAACGGGNEDEKDKTVYEKQVEEFVDSLGNGEEFIRRKPLQSFLQSFQKESAFVLDMEGNAYLKTA